MDEWWVTIQSKRHIISTVRQRKMKINTNTQTPIEDVKLSDTIPAESLNEWRRGSQVGGSGEIGHVSDYAPTCMQSHHSKQV